jgi:hypothetical protein
VVLAEVIADLGALDPEWTIYTDSLAPAARAFVRDDDSDVAERYLYAVNVGAAQAALRRAAPCPWRRPRLAR